MATIETVARAFAWHVMFACGRRSLMSNRSDVKILVVALVLTLTAPVASAHRNVLLVPEGFDSWTPSKQSDYLSLFHHCEPIRLFVTNLSKNADRIGLRREAILATAERVLRGSGLLGGYQYHANLVIHALVISNSVAIWMEYRKPVRHTTNGAEFWATTWADGGLYSHEGEIDSILRHVRNSISTFVFAYTRVNAKSCDL